MPEHLIGLLLGTEDDWPRAFESIVARLPPLEHRGATHVFRTSRVLNEPFNLRGTPRYELGSETSADVSSTELSMIRLANRASVCTWVLVPHLR